MKKLLLSVLSVSVFLTSCNMNDLSKKTEDRQDEQQDQAGQRPDQRPNNPRR